jgi:TetR/AcrR family transcriptional repressor of nem operon
MLLLELTAIWIMIVIQKDYGYHLDESRCGVGRIFMGHSRLEKQKTHEKIVEIASHRLRERGLEGVGVADLMKEAGLTVGGFYKHFASRDHLVAEAVQSAFASWGKKLADQGIEPADLSISEVAANYMSQHHRDRPGDGCPFPALTADLARSGPEARAIATARLKENFKVFEGRIGGEDNTAKRKKAIVAFSVMAGAVGLARVVDDEALSQEILEAVKKFVTDLDE